MSISKEDLLAQVQELAKNDPTFRAILMPTLAELGAMKYDAQTLVSVTAMGGLHLTLAEIGYLYYPLSKTSAYYALTAEQKIEHGVLKATGVPSAAYVYGRETAGEVFENTVAVMLKTELEGILTNYGINFRSTKELEALMAKVNPANREV
jgi:hypothetical protein